MKKTLSLLLYLLLLIHLQVFGQESTEAGKDTALIRHGMFSGDIEGGAYYQAGFWDIYLPGPLKQRRLNEGNIRRNWQLYGSQATDNPLYHLATYATFHTRFDISRNFEILASLTGEHRGSSYGVYPADNMVVFPQYRVTYKDTFNLKSGRKLRLHLGDGNYNNIRFAEGLMLYNIDVQGAYVKAELDGWSYEMRHVADLLNGIGLNTDEALHSLVAYEGLKKQGRNRLKLGLGYMVNLATDITVPYDMTPRNTIDATFALYDSTRSRFYAQLSYRHNIEGDAYQKFGGVVGYNKRTRTGRWQADTRVEGRYYGRLYKSWFHNWTVYYRDTAPGRYGLNYANTIGESLYPLRNYERPFSQFAVFSEYTFGDMGGLTFYTDATYRLNKRFLLRFVADLNVFGLYYQGGIQRDNLIKDLDIFAYPFFTGGICWEPARHTRLQLGITNKGMNLDKPYQTFYLYKIPMVHLQFTRTVGGFMGR